MKIGIPFTRLTSFSHCDSFLPSPSLRFTFPASEVFFVRFERWKSRSRRHRHASLNTRCFDHKWKFFSRPRNLSQRFLAERAFLCLAVAWIFNETGWKSQIEMKCNMRFCAPRNRFTTMKKNCFLSACSSLRETVFETKLKKWLKLMASGREEKKIKTLKEKKKNREKKTSITWQSKSAKKHREKRSCKTGNFIAELILFTAFIDRH